MHLPYNNITTNKKTQLTLVLRLLGAAKAGADCGSESSGTLGAEPPGATTGLSASAEPSATATKPSAATATTQATE